ncbi:MULTISPECIES: hypothetical protein [unclassified Microcoleus]
MIPRINHVAGTTFEILGQIRILRQLLPEARLIVVFDPGDRS